MDLGGSSRWHIGCGGGGQVATTAARAAPLAAGAYFKPGRAAPRFAKPSVMQGVPLPTRGCSRSAGRKSGTRRSGAAARAASTRGSSEVSSVS